MMKLIRLVLGKMILTYDALFSPTSLVRTPDQQAKVDQATSSMVIYQLKACPFCVKVRREAKRLGLNMQYKNVEDDPRNQQELMDGGKIDQVPCLRQTDSSGKVTWMYESSAINEFLNAQFLTQT